MSQEEIKKLLRHEDRWSMAVGDWIDIAEDLVEDLERLQAENERMKAALRAIVAGTVMPTSAVLAQMALRQVR